MGKLGKKARKFARKNLQSVMRHKRKLNSKFKKKKPSRDENDIEEQVGDASALSTGRTLLSEDVEDLSLDILSSEEDDDMVEDASDSEGYLSEDPSCSYTGGNDNGSHSEDTIQGSELSAQNQKLLSELSKKKKKLEVLKNKDSNFVNFLQDRIKDHKSLQNEELSDEDEMNDDDMTSVNGGFRSPDEGNYLNSSTINSWCQIVKEQHKPSVLPSLLNAYRAACHYGVDSTNAYASVLPPKLLNQDTICNVIMFMLSESDNLFRCLLGISSNCKVDAVLDLKTTSKWESVKRMIKSYITSSLFLLNQFTDTDILVFSLNRLRASLIFFAAFPSLLGKLIEASVHLWATGGGALSSCSFLILNDVSSLFGHEYYEKCLRKTYRAIMSRCKVVDATSLKHIEYLVKSFVELCSIDMQKSIEVATISTRKLARILQSGLQTKKVALTKICSWEYAICIDLWVTYVSVNIRDNDLHGLLFTIIQVINGVVNLFGAQRYLPLKVRCIQWLNRLSSSSEIFIPVSLFILDILESSSQEVGKPGKNVINLSTILKLPKYWLKTRDFQEECAFAAVELLAAHFLQWSHYISFPELATIPIIRLKQFHEKSTVESLRRMVKRLIDQVEKNIDFVQRKRDEISFSPKDQGSADSFLQTEKSNACAPYIQYYRSIIQNATTRKVNSDDQTILAQRKSPRQKKRKLPQKAMAANGERESEKTSTSLSNGSLQGVKGKKQKKGV